MNSKEFDLLCDDLLFFAEKEARLKRNEYTGHSHDVLDNFKRIASRLGQSPLEVWAVYFNKHVDSINSYVKNGGELSETLESRFADSINYLMLGYALIKEDESPKVEPKLSLVQRLRKMIRQDSNDDDDSYDEFLGV